MDNRVFYGDAYGSAPNPPSPGSTGFINNGESQQGIPATKIGAWWLHATPEEVRNVIVPSGLTPDVADLTQLFQAIKRLTLVACLAKKTSAQTITNSLSTIITQSAAEYDDDGSIWSAGQPSRLTVPAGYNRAWVAGSVGWVASSAGQRTTTIRKNNTTFVGEPHMVVPANSIPGTPTSCGVCSGWIPVTGGDYFELIGTQNSGGNLDCAGDTTSQQQTWLYMGLKV